MSTDTVRREVWELAHDHGFNARARALEMWRYRRLVAFFAGQAFRMLYAKTQLGWLWVVIRSATPVLVGAFVYGSIMNVPSGRMPYLMYLLVGSLAWNCFDGPWTWGTRGMELNRQVVTKLYFPRMILPLATMSPGFADPMVNAGLLLVVLVYYRIADGVWYLALSPRLLLAPLPMVSIAFLAFSLSLFTSVWNARARDVRYVLGFVIGFWMFATPVIWPVESIPVAHRWLLWLNPLAPLVEAFKWTLFDNPLPPWWAFALTGGSLVAVFTAGFQYFAAQESAMADKL